MRTRDCSIQWCRDIAPTVCRLSGRRKALVETPSFRGAGRGLGGAGAARFRHGGACGMSSRSQDVRPGAYCRCQSTKGRRSKPAGRSKSPDRACSACASKLSRLPNRRSRFAPSVPRHRRWTTTGSSGPPRCKTPAVRIGPDRTFRGRQAHGPQSAACECVLLSGMSPWTFQGMRSHARAFLRRVNDSSVSIPASSQYASRTCSICAIENTSYVASWDCCPPALILSSQ